MSRRVYTALSLLLSLSQCRRPATQSSDGGRNTPTHVETAPAGTVERLAMGATQPSGRDDARAGDLMLRGTDNTLLVFAASSDLAGHRPIGGSLIDARAGLAHSDPLFYARPAWFGSDNRAHPIVSRELAGMRCPGNFGGVRVLGVADGVRLEQVVCARAGGHFTLTTRALTPLPTGATMGEQVDAGSATALVEGVGQHWTERASTSFLALAEQGQALLFEGHGLTVVRGDGAGREHDDLTALLLQVRFAGTTGSLDLTPVEGDALSALSAVTRPSRTVTLRGPAGELDLLDAAGELLAQGLMPSTGQRLLRLPVGFATQARFRDAEGIETTEVALGPSVTAPAAARTRLNLSYVDGEGQPIAVHVLFHALDAGQHDPTPRVTGGGFSGGRSVYLTRGQGSIALPSGRYRVTANHGPRYSLDVREVVVAGNAPLEVTGTLREVVLTPDWISGDLHLHSINSPDSHVTLDERVASLYCEGVDFAVATDHNHVSDYTPALERQAVSPYLATLPGIEVTTFSPSWGHFIAFPMTPGGARTESVVPFLNTTPERIFADARSRGAQVIQVNHPRLEPSMGYFNFTHFNSATGQADPTFANGFDSVEVFNGWLHEYPDEIRSILRDFVGLVRRGIRPAATGNSDSHFLLFEEAGWPRTYIFAPRDPVESRGARVLDGIRRGHTVVSGGPMVELTTVDGGLPGDIVRPRRGEVRVRLRVRAPAWIPVERVELWIDDGVAQTFTVTGPPVDGVRFERELVVPITRDVTLLAWADARTPLPDVLATERAIPMGFTTPIYVDADGDGRIRLAPPQGPPVVAPTGHRAGR